MVEHDPPTGGSEWLILINKKLFILQTLVWQIILRNRSGNYAEVAHLVEHDLAKVGVAGSSPVFRSEVLLPCRRRIFFDAPVVVPIVSGMVDTSRYNRDDPNGHKGYISFV